MDGASGQGGDVNSDSLENTNSLEYQSNNEEIMIPPPSSSSSSSSSLSSAPHEDFNFSDAASVERRTSVSMSLYGRPASVDLSLCGSDFIPSPPSNPQPIVNEVFFCFHMYKFKS